MDTESITKVSPGSFNRIRGALLYAGFALPYSMVPEEKQSSYMRLHCRQALALAAVFALIFFVLIVLILLLSYGMVFHRELMEQWPTEAWLLSLGRKLLIAWAVFWGHGLVQALRGSASPTPYLHGLARRPCIRSFGRIMLLFFLISGVLLSLLTVNAECHVGSHLESAHVFIVYDDLGRFPRSLFSLAVYPIARAATQRWGMDSVALLPLSAGAIQNALVRGRFIVIASHGTARGLLVEEGYYTPEDVPAPGSNPNLSYVYLAGCDSGAQRQAWEKALHPATVKTYDRMTPVFEHVWWFWTQGPAIVRALP